MAVLLRDGKIEVHVEDMSGSCSSLLTSSEVEVGIWHQFLLELRLGLF